MVGSTSIHYKPSYLEFSFRVEFTALLNSLLHVQFRRYCPSVEDALTKLNVSWYYTWKNCTRDAGICCPAGIEHVPMIWSDAHTTAECIAAAQGESCPYLLGFNEPDNKDQANMRVEKALALWPLLLNTGKILGSPATAENPNRAGCWLDQFMKGAKTKGYRVDFLAVHYYGENSARWDVAAAVKDMKTFLAATYKKYKKPIWVTEWALVTWFPLPSRYPSEDIQAAFVKAAAQMMDSLPYVERYAFFSLPPYSLESALGQPEMATARNKSSHLVDFHGNMTIIGEAYAKAGSLVDRQ